METRTILYTKTALKALKRMPANDAKRVQGKVDQFAADPASLANNVKALAGSDYIRLRVGDYRVIMTADLEVVEVITVGVRGGVYE